MSDTPTSRPDASATKAFAERVFGDFRAALVSMLCSLGDRLGLFTALATGPATSAEFAARAGIHERYAREWLSGLTAAGYLAYDATTQQFRLPPEHAPVLAQEPTPFSAGYAFQHLFGWMGMMEDYARAFQDGKGIPQAAYSQDMWQAMERSSAIWVKYALVRKWLPRMPDVLAKLERGAAVADVGCGRANALIRLAQAFPHSSFVGYDAFAPTVEAARANVAAAGLAERIRIELCDAAEGLPETFDIIATFDVIHDAAQPLKLLQAMRQALRPEGLYVCLEPKSAGTLEENVGPFPAMWYACSLFYCMSQSLANDGAALGAMGTPEAALRELCQQAGFGTLRSVETDDPSLALYEVRA
ncbi:MAG TPA: class I SAM-dependent methyltransferase [Ktedonobacterales bacterium]|jgi:SAM-dependent methyltransferase